MSKCPDLLTIQAIIDGEDEDIELKEHLNNCGHCQLMYQELSELCHLADSINSRAKLPKGFNERLAVKISPRPFPSALVAAVLFLAALFSAWAINPGYLEWWITVGITRQFGYLLDTFFDLIYIGHMVGPTGIIVGLTALVLLEVFILNTLSKMEGKANV